MIGGQKVVFEVAGHIIDQRACAGKKTFETVNGHTADFVPPRVAQRTDDVVVTSARLGRAQVFLRMKHIAIAAIDFRQHEPRLFFGPRGNEQLDDGAASRQERCPELAVRFIVARRVRALEIIFALGDYVQHGAFRQPISRETEVQIRGTV